MRCETCNKEYSPDCDYKQGRCPHHEPLLVLDDKPFPTWLLLLASPFIIGVWMIMNPRKVWEQAKQDWNMK